MTYLVFFNEKLQVKMKYEDFLGKASFFHSIQKEKNHLRKQNPFIGRRPEAAALYKGFAFSDDVFDF